MSSPSEHGPDGLPGWLHAVFVCASVAALVFFGIAIAREVRRPPRVEQRIVEALGVVDRCETCHDAASHPGRALVDHQVERFGCTPCHGGQGLATDKESAHRAQADWERPLHSLAERDAACGRCHKDAVAGLAELERGRVALAERGCSGCHQVPGAALPDIAPGLSGLGAKLQPAWVRAWLTDPKALSPAHVMPKFRLEGAEIEALVAFLFSTERPSLDPLPEPGGSVDRGRTAVATRRCATCHRIEGRGGSVGPSLDLLGAKVAPIWLYNYLLDVHRLRPGSRMPGFRLPPAEAADIVAYATEQLTPDSGATPWSKHAGEPDAKLASRGRELFVELGCGGCHSVAGLAPARSSVSLASLGDRRVGDLPGTAGGERFPDVASWVQRKVLDPRAFELPGAARSLMPAYEIAPEEARAMGIAINAFSALPVPAQYQRLRRESGRDRLPTGATLRVVERYRCLVCHRVGDLGGDVSKVPLDGVSSRLGRPWLDEFLRDPTTVRMGQAERMPVLGMSAEEARLVANWLESALADERIGDPAPFTPDEARAGRGLYAERGCAKCHVAEGSGEIQAPVLDGSRVRLRPGYVLALLEQGPRVVPGGRHPEGTRPTAEARALAAYVLSLDPPRVEADKPGPKAPTGEPQ